MLLWRVLEKTFSPVPLARSLGEETSRAKPHVSLKKKIDYFVYTFSVFAMEFPAAYFISFTFPLLFICLRFIDFVSFVSCQMHTGLRPFLFL